jgi:phosphopantothenoylcysteine decarboxylase/phosphopantothenate--cysteine ligase
MSMVKGRKMVVAVTGGIAAYKAAELVRLLVKEGVQVRVAMTRSATRFVAPLTFEALSGSPVIFDMWGPQAKPMDHISWGQDSDLIIVAPATANFVAKMAQGIGDDFPSTMILAATAPILVCPSMNTHMFENPAVQGNLKIIEDRGMVIMAPEEGELACRTVGPGRLPEPEGIVEEAVRMLSTQDLAGLKILVTAGATVEPIDPVRFVSNRSTGKMGYAVATAAWRRGAEVVLVSGPTHLAPPRGIRFVGVQTAEEMRGAVLENREGCGMIIKAAAVSDYRPRENASQKLKKGPDALSMDLIQNPDILAELGRIKTPSCVLVGFAAETQNLLANAQEKMAAKNLDMIVANDVSRNDAGFESDTNAVKILRLNGDPEDLPLMTKDQLAHVVLDRAKELVKGRRESEC